ncbi:hypothetical protein JTB14_010851 [Gonioctena quinquepunctata]|nr:hypothetical protein JTB14_010851 [Gonioctena quinquepunctata]
MAINTYVSYLVEDTVEGNANTTNHFNDLRARRSVDSSWTMSYCGFPIVPWGARKVMQWLKEEYNNPEILITEVGICDDGSTLHDRGRIAFFHDYLNAFLDAMYEDGVNIFGIAAWSLIDNFEWLWGYSARFGIFHVDYEDANKARTPKDSADFFIELISTRKIPSKASVVHKCNFILLSSVIASLYRWRF